MLTQLSYRSTNSVPPQTSYSYYTLANSTFYTSFSLQQLKFSLLTLASQCPTSTKYMYI